MGYLNPALNNPARVWYLSFCKILFKILELYKIHCLSATQNHCILNADIAINCLRIAENVLESLEETIFSYEEFVFFYWQRRN